MGEDWYRSCPLAAPQEVTKRNVVSRATTSGTIPKQLTGQSPKDACPMSWYAGYAGMTVLPEEQPETGPCV